MDWEDYATNDSAHGGSCLTPADIERGELIAANEALEEHDRLVPEDERDRLVAAIRAEQEQEEILQASRAVRRGDDMLFAALRKNGVL